MIRTHGQGAESAEKKKTMHSRSMSRFCSLSAVPGPVRGILFWAVAFLAALLIGAVAFVIVLCLEVRLFSEESALPDDDFGMVADFSLTERSGQSVERDDLRGRVWVASFVFTRCAGACQQITGNMARLQRELEGNENVVLVSFTVDPEYDTPQILRAYADRYKADPKRWLFLTGEPKTVYHLIQSGFYVTAVPNQGEERKPGYEVTHASKLVVLDRRGHMRAYLDATEPDVVDRVKQKIEALVREKP